MGMTRLVHILALTVAVCASYYALCAAITDADPRTAIVVAVLALGADVFVVDHHRRRRMAAAREAVWQRRIREMGR